MARVFCSCDEMQMRRVGANRSNDTVILSNSSGKKHFCAYIHVTG
jgi:hypothetical protein